MQKATICANIPFNQFRDVLRAARPMTPEQYQEELERWEVQIGKFIIACGVIEKASYELLLQLPTEDLSRQILKMGLVARIDFIIDLLPQRISNESLVDELIHELELAKSTIGLRNIIAHNPVDLSLFDSEHGALSKQVVSRFDPDLERMRKTEVDVLEMEEKCRDMELLASRITQLQYRVEYQLWGG